MAARNAAIICLFQIVVDDLLNQPQKTYTVFESASEQDVVIRIVKLSEAIRSTAGILELNDSVYDLHAGDIETGSLEYEEAADRIHIYNESTNVVFSKEKAEFISVRYHNRDYFTGGANHFYRPPTGIDAGVPGETLNYANDWRSLGLDSSQKEIKRIWVYAAPASVIIQVHALYHGCIETRTDYTIGGKGIEIANTVVNNVNVDTLPRIGLSFTFSDAWNNIKWYGRGPWENYADRKTSAFVGIYESSVQEQHVTYIVPVECGGKEDVRYLVVSADDRKVKVAAAGHFHFDIRPYSIGQYDNAAYEDELGAYSFISIISMQVLAETTAGPKIFTMNIKSERASMNTRSL